MRDQVRQPHRHFGHSNRGIQKPRDLTCKKCHKQFSRSDNLRTHQRIHTGEMPYSCRFCGKAFRWKSALSNHEDLHELNLISVPSQQPQSTPRTPPPSPEHHPDDGEEININITIKNGKNIRDVIKALEWYLNSVFNSESSHNLSEDRAEIDARPEAVQSKNISEDLESQDKCELNDMTTPNFLMSNVPSPSAGQDSQYLDNDNNDVLTTEIDNVFQSFSLSNNSMDMGSSPDLSETLVNSSMQTEMSGRNNCNQVRRDRCVPSDIAVSSSCTVSKNRTNQLPQDPYSSYFLQEQQQSLLRSPATSNDDFLGIDVLGH